MPNAALMVEFMDAMNAADYDRVERTLHQDTVHEFPFVRPPVPKINRGRKTVAEFYRTVPRIFAVQRWVPDEIYECPIRDAVIIAATMYAVTRTNYYYSNRYTIIATARDGLILSWREMFDPRNAAAMLEAVELPAT